MAQEKRTVRDRYGFLVEVPVQRPEAQEDAIARTLKNMWNTVLKPNPSLWMDLSHLPPDEVLKHRMLKSLIRECGIPESLRKHFWPIISGSDQLRMGSRVVYSDIITTLRAFKNSSTEQIERDLSRSFPGHAYFDSEAGQQALRNVLTAFSWLNPAVGYTQSMNFWAGLMLVFVSSEEAVFWLVVTVIERILPQQYYDNTMLDIIVDNQILFTLLDMYLPRVHQHISNYTTDLSPILTQWFLCLFVNTLPTELTLRILDCFLFEGNKILLRVALGIFKCYEADILKTNSFEDLFLLIARPIKIQDSDGFMALIFDRIWLRAFGRDKLSQLRQNVKEATMREEERKAQLRRTRTAAKLGGIANATSLATSSSSNTAAGATSNLNPSSSSANPSQTHSSAPNPSENDSHTPINTNHNNSSAIPSLPPPPSGNISPPAIKEAVSASSSTQPTSSQTQQQDSANYDRRKTIRISALPDDVKSVIDRRSWRAYNRSQEWHMIEEYFNSMEWSTAEQTSPRGETPKPDSGTRRPLSVTDPDSVPKAAKTRLYKSNTIGSSSGTTAVPVLPVAIAAQNRENESKNRSNNPKNGEAPSSPSRAPQSPTTPTTPTKVGTFSGSQPKRRSYADVAKSGLETSESSSSSSSTGSPRGAAVLPGTQQKFFAATSSRGGGTRAAPPGSPRKPVHARSNTSLPDHSTPTEPANAATSNSNANQRGNWNPRAKFGTLGKNISNLVSSLTKGNSSAHPAQNTSATASTSSNSHNPSASSSTSPSAAPAKSGFAKASPSAPTNIVSTSNNGLPTASSVPSVRIGATSPIAKRTVAQSNAKLAPSPPTMPAPSPPTAPMQPK